MDLFASARLANSASTASGVSSCGRCPAPGSSRKDAPGIAAAYSLPYPGVNIRSASPQTTSVSAVMPDSRAVRLGSAIDGPP